MNLLCTLMFSILLAAGPAMAKTYTCEIINDTASEDSDRWSALVNTSAKTVRLSSDWSFFGPNPFATLTLASEKIAKQYVRGVTVFAGGNKYNKTDKYIFVFDPTTGQGEFEAIEARGKTRWFGTADCQPTRK